MSVAFVFLTVGISMMKFEVFGIHVGFSSLLVCMMLGTVFCNVCDLSEELMDRVERWSAPLLVIFFVLNGAELEFSVFAEVTVLIVGVVYIISRSLGKYFGAFTSAKISHCDPTIVKYLGITLLPQAGVALGMAMKASALGAEGVIVANRHIHMSPDDARVFGAKDGDTVTVDAEGARRTRWFDVQVRVHKDFRLEMHIDTDDANAACLKNGSTVKVVK